MGWLQNKYCSRNKCTRCRRSSCAVDITIRALKFLVFLHAGIRSIRRRATSFYHEISKRHGLRCVPTQNSWLDTTWPRHFIWCFPNQNWQVKVSLGHQLARLVKFSVVTLSQRGEWKEVVDCYNWKSQIQQAEKIALSQKFKSTHWTILRLSYTLFWFVLDVWDINLNE